MISLGRVQAARTALSRPWLVPAVSGDAPVTPLGRPEGHACDPVIPLLKAGPCGVSQRPRCQDEATRDIAGESIKRKARRKLSPLPAPRQELCSDAGGERAGNDSVSFYFPRAE